MSPLAPHKADLVSLVVPVIRGREQRLVVVGLDLCRGVLTLPGYLGHKEVLDGLLYEVVAMFSVCRFRCWQSTCSP